MEERLAGEGTSGGQCREKAIKSACGFVSNALEVPLRVTQGSKEANSEAEMTFNATQGRRGAERAWDVCRQRNRSVGTEAAVDRLFGRR